MSFLDRIKAIASAEKKGPTVVEPVAGRAPAPKVTIEVMAKASARALQDHMASHDVYRIINLPDVTYDGTDRVAVTNALKLPDGALQLNQMQAQMLTAAQEADGGLFMVGTGHGKAWTALLVGTVVPCTRVLLFAPSSTLGNLRKEKLRIARHFQLNPGIQLHSIESLQRPTKEGEKDLIEELILRNEGDPAETIIVVDEAHALRNLDSARGKRFMRTILAYPQLRVFLLSGSMTEQSLTESAHLSWMALRERSPFPAEWSHAKGQGRNAADLLKSWSACLDVTGKPTPKDWEAFLPLWAKYHPTVTLWDTVGRERTLLAREAFQKRLKSCIGVVVSSESSLQGCKLVLKGINDVAVPESVEAAITEAEMSGLDPDGNILPDPLAVSRVTRQLALGFYYVWDWPVDLLTGKPRVDVEWLKARSEWNAAVRRQIKYAARTGYDSAFLVYQHVQRVADSYTRTPLERAWVQFVGRSHKDEGGDQLDLKLKEKEARDKWLAAGGSDEAHDQVYEAMIHRSRAHKNDLCEMWLNWSSRHKHRPQPPTKAVWMSYFLIEDVVRRARELEAQGHHPIVWYDYKEVGDALSRIGKIPAYGAGTTPPTDKPCTLALSVSTHSEGKNMQAWHTNIVLSPRPSNKKMEQLLGRTYRPLQESKEVTGYLYQHADVFVEAIHKARAQADYVQITYSNSQKLLYAQYENIKIRTVGADLYDDTAIDTEDELLEDA